MPHPRTENPSPIELALAVLTGAGHVVLELATSGMQGAAESFGRPQHVYNLSAAVAWGAYLVWRLVKVRDMARIWGFRREGFYPAMRISALFSAAALLPLLAIGWYMQRLPLPGTFWLIVAIYPLYGIAQQFVLQSLVTRNLRGLIPRLPMRALAAATLFALAHFPNMILVGLTFAAGLGFTWIFEKHRNLWAVGIAHGMLGSLAYYLVVGQDPGAELLNLLKSG